MTGDGVRLALEGGRLAAETALECLDRPAFGARAHLRLLERRRAAFGWKLQVNRLLRREPFDLVFFSTTQFPVMILGAYWKRRFGIPAGSWTLNNSKPQP